MFTGFGSRFGSRSRGYVSAPTGQRTGYFSAPTGQSRGYVSAPTGQSRGYVSAPIGQRYGSIGGPSRFSSRLQNRGYTNSRLAGRYMG